MGDCKSLTNHGTIRLPISRTTVAVLPLCPKDNAPLLRDRLRPDHTDCHKYYECQDGVPIRKTCDGVLVFGQFIRVRFIY